MNVVDLNQFASLFEIGFALHFAVAFLDGIYAKELPVRLERITAMAKSLERLRDELARPTNNGKEAQPPTKLQLMYRTIETPEWTKHNNHVLDRVYALGQESSGQMKVLKRVLSVITFLSIGVVLYSVGVLFLIGLNIELVQDLNPMTASMVVLMQLLPLPIAASVFFYVARRMSQEIDRKTRGVGELQLMFNQPDATTVPTYASVEQIFQRERGRSEFAESR